MIGGATIQRDFATLICCILVGCVLLNNFSVEHICLMNIKTPMFKLSLPQFIRLIYARRAIS